MFYSHCLLSRKGALGTIWVAAHCLKRLNKHQVSQTNISSSVEKILLDEVPVVSYRVLGYLLLGVVRIYSKKVQYLFHDCRHVLVKINNFAGKKKANVHIEAICPPPLSITRPERLELDTFDLQILEDGIGLHTLNVRPDEDIILTDAWKNEGSGLYLLDKYHCDEDAEHFEACSTAYTPVKDVLSPYTMVGNDVVPSSSHNLSNTAASIEKFRGNNFSLEERLHPMLLCEFDEEPGLDGPFGEKYQIDIEQIEIPDTKNVIRAEEEPLDILKPYGEEQEMSAEQVKSQQVISPESSTKKDRLVSITVDVTPPSKCSNTPGATTPDFMVVKTPAAREPARVSRKRKCLLDDILVLPNKVVKESIDDSSDLVCKRRKAPHKALLAWKAHKISNLPHTFWEPLIPCEFLSEVVSLPCKKKLKSPEAVEPVEAPEKIGEIGSPIVHRVPDEADIAPSTPVTCSSSLRLHEDEVQEYTDLDRVGRASPLENTEKVLSLSEDTELDTSLINEMRNPGEGDNGETNEWSIRTRTIARYLHRSFRNRKKQRGDSVVSLSQVLKRKTKTENARVFYEILALKSGGYIDVKQHSPYEDVLILETPKLQEFCES